MTALSALEKYAKQKPLKGERCELCAAPLHDLHGHVVDIVNRRLCCACHPCSILFQRPESGGQRFRAVPDRVLVDSDFRLDEKRWESLEIPVRLAFIFLNSSIGRWVSVYPSPGGATELVLEADDPLATLGSSPMFTEVAADVEGILVYGPRGSSELECMLVPIDRCYELVSLVRRNWKGFDGGDAREMIDGFFASLRGRAGRIGERKP